MVEKSLWLLDTSGGYDEPIVKSIREAGAFYAAESYHQDYYKNNPWRYKLYRWNSGRDSHLAKVWGEGVVSR